MDTACSIDINLLICSCIKFRTRTQLYPSASEQISVGGNPLVSHWYTTTSKTPKSLSQNTVWQELVYWRRRKVLENKSKKRRTELRRYGVVDVVLPVIKPRRRRNKWIAFTYLFCALLRFLCNPKTESCSFNFLFKLSKRNLTYLLSNDTIWFLSFVWTIDNFTRMEHITESKNKIQLLELVNIRREY